MKPTRLMSPPGTYFATFSTFQRRRFFIVESYARLFLKTLYHYRRQGRFQLHAFVLMPDHVHLLLTPAPDITLERAMQLIKGGYSHAVGQEISRREIWQKGFTDHRIRDPQDFAGHRLYIHQNPAMGNLVATPAEYRYCSAFPGFKLDPWPPASAPERHDSKSCPSRPCSLAPFGKGTTSSRTDRWKRDARLQPLRGKDTAPKSRIQEPP
jgi:putative transposase